MNTPSFLSFKNSALVALGMLAGAIAPLVISLPVGAQTQAPSQVPSQVPGQTPAQSPTPGDRLNMPAEGATPQQTTPGVTPSPQATGRFVDLEGSWAQPFVEALAARGIVVGYPGRIFNPNRPVDRAEFAAMLQQAFDQTQQDRALGAAGFTDVPQNHWAAAAIEAAYEAGFMQGYPNNTFRPTQGITKAQGIVALANGLRLEAPGTDLDLSNYYNDANAIPDYATEPVSAATEAGIVVNYPNVQQLQPTQVLSRAEAAALIHQALVEQGRLEPIAANTDAAAYIVGRSDTTDTAEPGTAVEGEARQDLPQEQVEPGVN